MTQQIIEGVTYWCYECDTETEPNDFGLYCLRCDVYTRGVTESQRDYVSDLRDTLRNDSWRIPAILDWVERHIKDLAQCEQCLQEAQDEAEDRRWDRAR